MGLPISTQDMRQCTCDTCRYGLWNSSSFWGGGDLTPFTPNVPSAVSGFNSTSIERAADTCLHTPAAYTKAVGFAYITSLKSNALARVPE